jgi:hypothetical protein
VLYLNDNYGDFSATRQDLIDRALKGRRPDLVEPILPAGDCAFLTKVRHSAFYATPLEYVLSSSPQRPASAEPGIEGSSDRVGASQSARSRWPASSSSSATVRSSPSTAPNRANARW